MTRCPGPGLSWSRTVLVQVSARTKMWPSFDVPLSLSPGLPGPGGAGDVD